MSPGRPSVILLDTHVILFDALSPDRLSRSATQALKQGFKQTSLACSDISLWEISMLLKKGRLQVDTADPAVPLPMPIEQLCHHAVQLRNL
jgi:PIN domain nuclease of toxin-antitoxin system